MGQQHQQHQQQSSNAASQCSISELTCTNGKCVPLNKFCDNVNDCGDSSDEPRFCTSKLIKVYSHGNAKLYQTLGMKMNGFIT